MAQDEAFRNAEEKIEQARVANLDTLDLSNVGLSELPESLTLLSQLKNLSLDNNSLTALPDGLKQLKQLEVLGASFNKLAAIPEWLGQLERLQEVNFSRNGLETLPESLGQLKELRTVSFSGIGLTAIPEFFGKLTQLQQVTLNSNGLTTLPDWFSRLTNLRSLHISSNQLTALPDSIGQLIELQMLDISNNRLTALPDSIGELVSLKQLILNSNQFTDLPKSLDRLNPLQSLYLAHNRLIAWPKVLNRLTHLQTLDLEDNRLTTLPESLDGLIELERLDLSRNQLMALPRSLSRLRKLHYLFLHDNPKLGLSPDVLGARWVDMAREKAADARTILAFYFGKQKRSAKPLNEVKLLLVGHGRVGKTSLSKALRGLPHDKTEKETPGIERHPLPIFAGRNKITAHVWDFGGQEFLHQTHQFFFSERSIYLVVLSGRQGRPMQEAEYWLRLIRTYGTGSPVVIALNQIKGHPFTVDEHFLQEKYPEVKAVVETDCQPRTGIEGLRKLLGRLAGEMPSVREKIDPAWARVRTKLEEMIDSFVTFKRYREICGQEGVKDLEEQEALATILDCLGIALNYREDARLRETSVLKPRWLVDGIYTVLRWMHKHKTNGELRLADFPKALKDRKTYPSEMHAFLLALMEKFELCFAVEGETGVYLAPGLLDANQPLELKKFLGEKARRIQFRYEEVRPPGLLPRFIVRSHTLSEQQPRWLRGVVLKRETGMALVRGDHEGRVTDVFVLGKNAEDRVWLSEFILSEMRTLNDKLPVRTFVESEATRGAWTELEVLREAARKNEETRTEQLSGGETVSVPVRQTLREVESPESSAPKESPLPLFICYSHDDERTVKQLIPSFKVLARRGYITPWRDTDLVPGEDWDETIKERLSKARIILFMVSQKFLASEYITQQERPLAMALEDEGKTAVVPVLLSHCTWQEEDFAKFENLPHKGKLVTAYNPRSGAWVLVEEGIKKAAEKVRAAL